VVSWLIGFVVPKDPHLVIFGGRYYGGNTAPLFERTSEVGLRGVWLTRDPRALALNRPGIVSARSWRGLWLGARAGTVVLTHFLADFNPIRFPSRRTRLFNTWHGIPIKKISTQDADFHKRTSARSNLREMKRFTGMFATSLGVAEIFARTFGLPLNRVYRTGQPRDDIMFAPTAPDIATLYDPPLPPHRKRILYCPTYRWRRPVRLFPFVDRDDEALQRFLEAHEAVLFVRTHPNDPGGLTERDRRLVPMEGSLVPEVNNVIPQIDVLVGDYSGIYYDSLLLDLPNIFLPYDQDEYARTPGFNIPFDTIAAGPKPSSQVAFLDALTEALDHPNAWAAERARVRAFIHEHTDGGATMRVLKIISAGLPCKNLSPDEVPR
jgi:CDP-glycerol glycerophosphotransferase (TagB/SpsB family)